jgi:hypothetical protein
MCTEPSGRVKKVDKNLGHIRNEDRLFLRVTFKYCSKEIEPTSILQFKGSFKRQCHVSLSFFT